MLRVIVLLTLTTSLLLVCYYTSQSKPLYEAVHIEVNGSLSYKEDPLDHWQTPSESRLLGSGDCEDYALMKHLLLRDTYSSRLVVGRLPDGQAHMVTSVSVKGSVYYLDNRHKFPVPSSKLDMKIIYMFDEYGMYKQDGAKIKDSSERFMDYLEKVGG